MSGNVYQYVIIYLSDCVYTLPAKKRKIDDNEGLTITSLNLQPGKQLKSSGSYSRQPKMNYWKLSMLHQNALKIIYTSLPYFSNFICSRSKNVL